MHKRNFILLLLLLVSSSVTYGQKLIKDNLITGICYAGDKINRIYIPPPDEFYLKAGSKGGASLKIYSSGFPDAAIAALEYAASILKSILPNDSDITVLASYEKITTQNVLANSSTTGYAPGWSIDAQQPFAYYPAALAEKILGEKLNFDLEGDIELVVNSSINWYFGTDGKTPTLSYDLVTVVVHELIHGLGFFDSMNVDESAGYYGAASVPLVYDTFIENLQGNKLVDTSLFPNPSAALKDELTGGQLYFKGPLLANFTSGGRAKLHVPATFDTGSSVSHLDENATLKENQLMTPFINRGEAIHNPGKLTMSMLGDLGWINTRIVHNAPRDTEEHISEINLTATIISDTVYNHDNVGLVWSYDNFITSDTVIMTSIQDDENFSVLIPVPSYGSNLEYYIYVEDYFRRIYRSPSHIPEKLHSVYIGIDTVQPEILHLAPDYYFEIVDSVRFRATVTDNLGIDTVYIEYKVNEGNINRLGLKSDGNELFSNSLYIKNLSITSNDSLAYRVVALDKSSISNIKILPADGFFYINFERINAVAESYSSDFTDAEDDFFNNYGFEITIPKGFTRSGLHTKHPYESPEETGDSIGYTAMLRTPIKFDPGGMIISYYDLALIEPGEAGSLYGSPEFYDYVIVEGSTNYGRTWFSLADGYDSRYQKAWETAYNSSIVDNNSVYQGDESMLVKHTIFLKPSSDIQAGDTMVIRFRLFSDPYANGWGWAVQDLHIGPLIDNIGETILHKPVIYPNPGNGYIMIRQTTGTQYGVAYTVYDISGSPVMNGKTAAGENIHINISRYPSGTYFIKLHNDNGNHIFKYNLIR